MCHTSSTCFTKFFFFFLCLLLCFQLVSYYFFFFTSNIEKYSSSFHFEAKIFQVNSILRVSHKVKSCFLNDTGCQCCFCFTVAVTIFGSIHVSRMKKETEEIERERGREGEEKNWIERLCSSLKIFKAIEGERESKKERNKERKSCIHDYEFIINDLMSE